MTKTLGSADKKPSPGYGTSLEEPQRRARLIAVLGPFAAWHRAVVFAGRAIALRLKFFDAGWDRIPAGKVKKNY
jgi:hypothetical protein